MKRALTIVVAVLIGIAFLSPAFAAAKKEKSVSLTGEVMKNDGKMMTVKGPSGEQEFDVAAVKNVDKYKMGDQVTIKYTEKDGKMTGSSISKKMMKGKEKMEMKETAPAPAK
jgi:hypothetical protein